MGGREDGGRSAVPDRARVPGGSARGGAVHVCEGVKWDNDGAGGEASCGFATDRPALPSLWSVRGGARGVRGVEVGVAG